MTTRWMNYVIPDPEVICVVGSKKRREEDHDQGLKLDQFSNYQMLVTILDQFWRCFCNWILCILCTVLVYLV